MEKRFKYLQSLNRSVLEILRVKHRRSKKKQRKRGFRVFENLGVKHR